VAEFGGFRVRIIGLLGGIASFIGGMRGITAKDLLRHLAYLQDQTVKLEGQHVGVFWSLGRALGGALATFATYIRDHTKPFLKYVGDRLDKIGKYLREKFATVLRFIKLLKDHINEFYQKYIRPIIDTIEFIRHVNRVLQVFHINLLAKLDRVLQQVEQRIEAPFDWTNRILTEVQNAIDRIVTLDGLLQRLTLLRSLDQYAPEWMRSFWEKQAVGMSPIVARELSGIGYPITEPATYADALAAYYRGRDTEIAGLADELAALWLSTARGVSA
jgi:hypothetical protein